MKSKSKNQNETYDSKIMTVSAKALPIWKILISWVGLVLIYYVSTQLLRGVFAYFFLCFGMVGVLTFQYGKEALLKIFGRMRKGTKLWMLFYLVMGFAVPLVLDIIIKPNILEHSSISSTN